jgi:hypothetical protein
MAQGLLMPGVLGIDVADRGGYDADWSLTQKFPHSKKAKNVTLTWRSFARLHKGSYAMRKRNAGHALAALAIAVMVILPAGSQSAPAGAAPQEARENNRKISATGSISGTIVIKEVSGNNIGNFTCDRIKVLVRERGAGGWSKTVAATGNFSTRRCSYNITGIPAEMSFALGIPTPEFPKGCDEKKFELGFQPFPMTVKTGAKRTYNLTITRIRCVLVT